MTDLGFTLRQWLGRRTAAAGAGLVLLAIAGAGGACAKQTGSPVGNGGDATTTSMSTSTHDAGSGGAGTGGAASTGGATTTTTTTTTTSTTTTTQTGTGGAGGMGTGGTGGAGGGFQPPVGSASYPAEMEPNDLKTMANPLQAGTKGFTASLYPLGDIDVFQFTVTVPGTSVSVATSDGMGGCPVGAKTYVRVFDDAGTVLAKYSGAGGCVSFDATNTTALQQLALGKYYVHVESANLQILPRYIVDIHVQAPVCGDSIIQVGAGEQCDHGPSNGAATDGCAATCQIKGGNYLNETEPNNTVATANNLDGHTGAVGQINPVGDVDYYSVSVTVAGSSITADIGDGFGGCPGGFDSHLSLYNPAGVFLTGDYSGGVSPCSKISPSKYAAAANLPVGKYFLKVERSSTSTQQSYVLKVYVLPPGCGDGLLQAGEQCDPGPGVTNPGCSATCQFAGDFIPETELNDTPATANPLGTHGGFVGAIKPAGDVDYYSFQVPGPNSLVFLQVSDGLGGCPANFDSLLKLYDPNGVLLLQDDNGGVNLCSRISPQLYPQAMNLPGGTYTTRVEFKGGNSAQSQYVLTISVVKQPGCGDSTIEAGEQCDDGPTNGAPGDGCSATCQAIPPWEIEPNNGTATATTPWAGFSTWKGSISPVGDHDYFTFTLAAAGKVTLTTHDIDIPGYCTSDTEIFLDDHSGVQLAFDDEGGPGPGDPSGGQCSKITQYPLAAGTYYVWVQRYHDTKIIPGYQLDLVVQ